jgi:Subtilase family
MNLKFYKSRFKLKAAAGLLIFSLLMIYFPASGQAAASLNQQTSGSYIVKLTSAEYYGKLLTVASKINKMFAGNKAPQFQNVYSFQSADDTSYLQNYLAGDFAYLELDQKISAAGIMLNDPGFTGDPQNIDKEWGLAKAGFVDAWQKTTGSKSNIVALIDTGVDATHQDLQSINYVPGFDFINKQAIPIGLNSDDNGHGTLVAGVLGASANNGIGVVGTNWQISVMPLKALDKTGKGDAATLAQAIIWAADHGAQFINLSVGGIGFGHDTVLADAITYAFNKNVLIVAAAGNDVAATGGNLDDNPVFPICDDNNYNMVIGVAATDQNDLKPDFSNYGKNCVDVDAPGKRILSTINFDPLTQKSAPNSYAYGSGTSLAVPFVVGQAALIKALYPTATNIQIRDRIINTAAPIDNLNLTQCGGASCRGLLGAGRIDVVKSLQTAIAQPFGEGDLVKVSDLNGAVYQILGGQKRLVSPFVFNQRFSTNVVITALSSQLASFPEGAYVTPVDGTLVKFDKSPTVYVIESGQKLPVTYQIFLQRGFSFGKVNTLSYEELNSWVTGSFLPPVDGTLMKGNASPTVYWVIGQVLHPVNYNFFASRGLNIFPIMTVPNNDVAGYPKGEAYIR